jgi:hypothetical protein
MAIGDIGRLSVGQEAAEAFSRVPIPLTSAAV